MRKTYRWAGVAVLLALATTPLACGGADDAQSDVDRELDLALAQADSATLADLQKKIDEQMAENQGDAETPPPTPETKPTPKPETKPTPKPQPKPEPKPAAPQFEELTVASGTSFGARLDQELSTRYSKVGDLFTVTTTVPLTDGAKVVVPAGTKIRGEVTVAQASGGSGKKAELQVQFEGLTVEGKTYPVSLSITQAEVQTKGRDSTGDKALKIGGGAAAGALVGQLIGKNTAATLVGAAVGAAAGTGLQMATEDVDAFLPEGSGMTLQLDQPLTVSRKIG